MQLVITIAAFLLGFAVAWLVARARLEAVRSRLETSLDHERATAQAQLQVLNDAQAQLSDAFKALSAEALRNNNQSFLDLARSTLESYQTSARGDLEKRQQAIDELVRPVRESLAKVDEKIQLVERQRVGAYQSLEKQIETLQRTETQLRTETGNLVQALRSPVVRGRWGEVQLRRVVEMAGMVSYCDFHEQHTFDTGDEGRKVRPDMVVRLPGERTIVVDAKAPLSSYLDAMDVTDEELQKQHMKNHARQIREHVRLLGGKSYWQAAGDANPEYVVLFLPGDHFHAAALQHDPTILDECANRNVILATPSTLIALLRTIASVWKEEKLAKNARDISVLGGELYKRIADLSGHWARLGQNLNTAVKSYNSAVGSLETRVLVTARKLSDLECAPVGVEPKELASVDTAVRHFQASELVEARAGELRGIGAVDDIEVVADVEAAAH